MEPPFPSTPPVEGKALDELVAWLLQLELSPIQSLTREIIIEELEELYEER